MKLDPIRTKSDGSDSLERPQTDWDIRDVQDMHVSPSGDRLALAGYAAQDYLRNLSNPSPVHLRSWINLPSLEVHHSLDTKHELSSFNPYRGRVLFLNNSQLVVDGISEVYLIDMETETRTLLGKHTTDVGDLAVNRSGTAVAAVGNDNRVTIFEKKSTDWKTTVKTLQGDATCSRIAFFDDDKIVVARSNGSATLLWIGNHFDDEALYLEGSLTWRTSREKTLNLHSARISVVRVSPDGRWIATAGEDRTIKVWSPYNYAVRAFTGSKRGITDVQFSVDSKSVIASDADGYLSQFEVEDSHLYTLPVEPDSKRHEELVSDSDWDEGGGLTQVILREHLGFIRDLAQTPSGHIVATTYDRRRTEWDQDQRLVSTAKRPAVTMAEDEDKSAARMTANALNDLADSDSREGRMLSDKREWADSPDRITLQIHPIPMPPGPPKNRAYGVFSPDGKWVFIFDYKAQKVAVWRISSPSRPAISLGVLYGELRSDEYGNSESDTHLRFSANGRYAAFPVSFDGEAICILDLQQFAARTFKADLVPMVFDVSNNGALVAAGRTGEVYVYDISKDSTTVLAKHGRYVSTVAISADGAWVASGSRDRSVRLWSVDSSRFCEFKFLNPVERVLFSLRGTELFVAAGRAVYSWYVPNDSDPLSDLNLNAIRGAATDSMQAGSRFPSQANNLAVVVERNGGSSLAEEIEATLGQKIQRTEKEMHELLDVLSSPKRPNHERVQAALELSTFEPSGLEGSLPTIIKQLRSETPERDPVFGGVSLILSKMGPTIVPQLRMQLRGTADPQLRLGLLHALGVLFPNAPPTRSDLKTYLTDQDEAIRFEAAYLLGEQYLDQSAIPVLLDAIESSGARDREAGDLLVKYGADAVPGLIGAFKSTPKSSIDDPREIARKAIVAIGSPGVECLISSLYTTHGEERAEVVRALAELGPKARGAVDALMTLYREDDSKDKGGVSEALAQIAPDNEEVADILVNEILHAQPGRWTAIYGIEKMNAAIAVPRLTNALKLHQRASESDLVTALGSFGEKAADAVSELITVLRTASDMREITQAIGNIGPPAHDAESALIVRLQTASGYDTDYLLEALGKIHPNPETAIPAIFSVIRQEAARSDMRRYRIDSQSLEAMRDSDLPDDISRRLERLDDGIGRPEALFTSLAIREIGAASWEKYHDQILSLSLESTHACDSESVFRDAFGAFTSLGPAAQSAVPEILKLREQFSSCADVLTDIDEAVRRIEPQFSNTTK